MSRRRRRGAARPSLFGRGLHEQARSLVAWTLGLFALGLAMTALYPTVRDNPQLAHLEESYPPALRSLFALSDLTSAVGYVRAEVFSLTGPLLVVALTVLWGSDLVAGEEERGTIDLLLANPVSRRRVLLEKWASLAAGTALASAGLGAGLGVGVAAFGLRIAAGPLVAAVVATGLLGLLYGSLALALGAATGRRGLARGVSVLLAVAAYLASGLADLVGWLGPARAASPWYHALGVDPLASGFEPWHLLVLAGMAVAVLALAIVGFERRDLAV